MNYDRRIEKLEQQVRDLQELIVDLVTRQASQDNDMYSNVLDNQKDIQNAEEEIDMHSECLDELAEIITDDEEESELQNECLDESAECISELYERIEALEEIIINGGNE